MQLTAAGVISPPMRLLHLVVLASAVLPAAVRAQADTATSAPSKPLPSDRASGAAEIKEATLRDRLTYLSSAELGGRATGGAGFQLAAEFVRSHFKSLELEPAFEDGFYQPVPWKRVSIKTAESALEVRGKDGNVLAKLTAEQSLRIAATNPASIDGPLAFVHFDGDRRALQALPLKDLAVIVISEKPVLGVRAYYGVSESVRRAGGKLLAVAEPELFKSLDQLPPASMPGGADRARQGRAQRFLRVALDRDQALILGVASGAKAPTAEAPVSRPAEGATLHLSVAVDSVPAPAHNVAAILRGSDPALRDEFVVVGSHLDHIPPRGGKYSPGADDDGSGTVAVLSIADAFAKNATPPRRSILFVTFCGEENGLIGSAWFAKNCPIPLESIVTELQLDMVGRSEEGRGESADDNRNTLHLVGTEKLSADLHEACLRINSKRAGFEIEWDEEDVFYRSDHWNFAREGVPVAFFFTGFHPDYHRTTDTVDKIEFPKLARVATYVYDLAFELAQNDERPRVDSARWESLERKGRKEPAAPVRTK